MAESKSPTSAETLRANRALTGSIVFAGVRCTMQYVILPFVLPWVGMTGSGSAVVGLILEIVAMGVIAYNIKALWSTSWRWRYLPIALLMLFTLCVFAYDDVQRLL